MEIRLVECAPELLDGDVNSEFEVKDTMKSFSMTGSFGRAVTRTYTLRINSKNIKRGHIKNWNSEWNDWEWDGDRLKEMDVVLAEAGKNGVKLIIPIINQDFGGESGEDTNWVGNFADLIRMKKGFGSYAETKTIDWWTDNEMIESFKLIIDKLLNRVNSLTGIRYGDDPTILAWETGNEMNYMGYRPAPASWTLTVAGHFKSLSKSLVMDGSFARTNNIVDCYPPEVLASPLVDIISFHYYGSGDISRVKQDCKLAKKFNKVFIAGEFGFFDSASDYTRFLSEIDDGGGAGSLVWSLRPRSSRSGFKIHGEGNGQWSYHVPGSSTPQHGEFDPREKEIVSAIRKASYKINREKVPDYPIPVAPERLWLENGTLVFTGSTWARHYELIARDEGGREMKRNVEDFTKEGCLAIDLAAERGRGLVVIRLRAVGVDGKMSDDSHEIRI